MAQSFIACNKRVNDPTGPKPIELPTSVPTNTICLSCTSTFTPTITGTPTSTFTQTDTYTPRYTNTPMVCVIESLTPTPTFTDTGYSLSVSVSFTGPYTVSTINPIVVNVNNFLDAVYKSAPFYTVYGFIMSNNESVTFSGMSVDPYEPTMLTTAYFNPFSSETEYFGAFQVGAFTQTHIDTCGGSLYSPVTINGNVAVTMVFGTNCRFHGLAGNYQYTGSGTVDCNHPIMFQVSDTPDFSCSKTGHSYYYHKGQGRYDVLPNMDVDMFQSTGPYYLRIFYDHNNDRPTGWSCSSPSSDCTICNHLGPGDPCKQLPGTYYTSTDLQAALDVILTDSDRCGN